MLGESTSTCTTPDYISYTFRDCAFYILSVKEENVREAPLEVLTASLKSEMER